MASSESQDNCRLFILGGKGCSEEDFRTTFQQYGSIKDLWIVKDRNTNEQKGVVYVTFEKVSEAALAMEEMNGRCIPNNPRPLKVIIASSRREGATRDANEDEKMLRLFIMVPKTQTEEDVQERFKEYGDIEYVKILKDRHTSASKGLAYVKFFRAYHAALAIEQCDDSYKAVFASSKEKLQRNRDNSREERYRPKSFEYDDDRRGGGSRSSRYEYEYGSYGGGYKESSGGRGSSNRGNYEVRNSAMDVIHNYRNDGVQELEVLASGELNQEQLYRLFDLVPGLEFCNFDRATGLARVKYNSSSCTAYARDKLDSFEYPTGYRISVRYPLYPDTNPMSGNSAQDMSPREEISQSLQQIARTTQNLQSGGIDGNIQQLVDTIKKATEVLEERSQSQMDTGSGLGAGSGHGGGVRKVRVRYCNVMLPETKPLASRDSVCVERLFIVSQPDSFPDHILQDCFCRFGNLIDVYFMPGKNYGYAKFKDMECAKVAIDTLHGQQVHCNRIKVMHADPPKYERDDGAESSKRPRI